MRLIFAVLIQVVILSMSTLAFASSQEIDDLYSEISSIATTLPGPYVDSEDHDSRISRIKTISRIIAEESFVHINWQWSPRDLGLATFVKTWNESLRFKLEVHNGKMRGDHGKSICLGQIMNGDKSLVGVDEVSTRKCISRVIDILIMHQIRCTNHKPPALWWMASIYAGYGTGHSCDPNAWYYKKDAKNNIILDAHNQPIKIHWAKQRARFWWSLREAKH